MATVSEWCHHHRRQLPAALVSSTSCHQLAPHYTVSHCIRSSLFTGLCQWRLLCFSVLISECVSVHLLPRAGSGVERTDPLRFLAGCRKRWLNQALSVLFLNLGFLIVSVITRTNFCVVLFCVVCVFYLLVVLVRLSVSVQVIAWKDSSPKWQCVDGDVKPYSLTHSLTHS